MLFIARRRLIRWLGLLVLAAIVAGQTFFGQAQPVFDSQVISRALLDKVVIIDPGHGGIDPGAVCRSCQPMIMEKDVVLQISFALTQLLEQSGASVVMTRRSDRSLSDLPPEARVRDHKREDLSRRLEIAQDHTADLFISIHGNGSPSSRWSGAQTFYYPGNSPLNRPLAQYIQREIISLVGRTRRTVDEIERQYILRELQIPAVNVEVGFLTNPEEARLLAQPDYQRQMAWAIFSGIVKFLAAEESGQLE